MGILENLNQTMLLLENFIPGFFSGAYKYYSSHSLRENVNNHPKENEAVIHKLRTELKHDIELYDFVKQRFNAQLDFLYSTRNMN